MSDELVFYTHPQCRAAASPAGCWKKSGQPYRTEILDYDGSMKAPAYLAINPMGKVPAIRHGEHGGDRRRPPSAPIWPTPFPRPASLRRMAPRRAAPITAGCSSGPVRSRRRSTTKMLGFDDRRERELQVGYGSFDG